MKLAEALILRADYQRRLEQLKQRLLRNARVQEGEKPAEDPKRLLEEVEALSAALLNLIQRINATNASNELSEGITISDAIAMRDVLRLKQTIYREMAQSASLPHDRIVRSEIKYKSTVSVADVQKTADNLAKEHRELDSQIQAINWTIELKE